MSILNILRNWLHEKSELGLRFWFAYDPITQEPSITLFMSYTSFILSIISLIALHFNVNLLTATSMSFVLTGMMIVFYMIRKINKASFNLKEQSINLENDEDEESKPNDK